MYTPDKRPVPVSTTSLSLCPDPTPPSPAPHAEQPAAIQLVRFAVQASVAQCVARVSASSDCAACQPTVCSQQSLALLQVTSAIAY